ncbi:glutathione S-transferase T3-like [Apium graveolens]|uniref:glutathione S-transferase T3-like n=1 Tax=Apium graveolens TaxID=4045 RepID=UPI003D78BAD3
MLLISAWLNVSMDPVQGNNQTHKNYWARIWKYYEENKERLESDRSANSLCNRWCTINEKVAKFIGYYNQICGRNQSGLTEQDKVDQTIEMYEGVMKEKFMFIRHWNALRFSPKYQASLAKKNKPTKDKDVSSQSVDSQIPTSRDSDEMMERPMGSKAAKKLKRAANEAKDEEGLKILKTMQKDALAIASSRTESIQISLQLQKDMMQLQKEELQLRLAKEERERQKEERERQVYEASIMAIDTSKMLPDQVKYYDALKARIMRNIS